LKTRCKRTYYTDDNKAIFIKNKIYNYSLHNEIVYRVISDDPDTKNGIEWSFLTERNFTKYFIPSEEIREEKLNEILK
jgi:hypothetical protein